MAMGMNKEMRTEMGMRARKHFAEDIDLADRFEHLFDVSFRVVWRLGCLGRSDDGKGN